MGLGKTFHLELPRRIVVYYLLFCLVSVIWLCAGAVFVTSAVVQSRAENVGLTRLSRVSSRFEIEYVRHGTEGFQALAEQIRTRGGLAYCAVSSPQGRYLAHSTRKYQGQPVVDRDGKRARWGQIERIRYVDADGRPVREYRAPLGEGTDQFATLHVGIAEPDALGMVMSTSEFLPVAVLGPLTFLGIGAFVLQRIVRPLADVEHQLGQLAVAPTVAGIQLKSVRVRGAASLGWNRLVTDLQNKLRQTDLDERLAHELRSRAQGRSDDWLNSIPEGLVVTDREGTITFANRAFFALAGWPVDEALPRDQTVDKCFELATVDPGNPLLKSSHLGRNVVSEICLSSESEERYLRLGRFPIRSGDADVHSRHIWSVRDITPQHLADKMRDEFLDSATHELRTPLANIKAYAETLALSDVMKVEQQKEFCNTINAEATRLARLIDDLLSVSSMESGSLAITRQNVEIDRLLRDVADKVRGQMEQRNITFETVLSEKLPELSLDKDKIATTLVNLLGNAAKYTPESGRVALKARVVDRDLMIEIEDSGIGISQEELPKIFDKFFRSEDPRVREVTGTGLGLALAQQIIRLHGGSLTVKSEVGEGSTFTVTLPAD